MNKFLIALTLLFLNHINKAYAIDKNDLKELRITIKDMCVQPDRKGEYMKIDGNFDAEATLKLAGVKAKAKISRNTYECQTACKTDQVKGVISVQN
jgi:hypothetical protein